MRTGGGRWSHFFDDGKNGLDGAAFADNFGNFVVLRDPGFERFIFLSGAFPAVLKSVRGRGEVREFFLPQRVGAFY